MHAWGGSLPRTGQGMRALPTERVRDRVERLRWQGDAQDRHRSTTGRHCTRRHRAHVAADTSSSSQRTCQRARNCSFPSRRACWKRPIIASTTRARCSRRSSSGAQSRNSTLPTHPPFAARRARFGQAHVGSVKDQAEFKQNNRSSPWARLTICPGVYAYFSPAQPYHWMLHEATHQLAREVSGFRRNRWIEEGLASYFSTSTLGDGGLQLGVVDSHAYPIWWLSRYRLTATRPATRRRSSLFPSKCC